MTGKNALPEIRYQARQAHLRRVALSLPALCAKARVERCDALLMKLQDAADAKAARVEWRRFHTENAARLNGEVARIAEDLCDPVAAVFTPADLVCSCGRSKSPGLFICWTCGEKIANGVR